MALWEDWWSIAKLKQKMAELESINRLSVFYREYMCEIVGDEDQLFKADDFRYYKGKVELDSNKNAYLMMEEPEKEKFQLIYSQG